MLHVGFSIAVVFQYCYHCFQQQHRLRVLSREGDWERKRESESHWKSLALWERTCWCVREHWRSVVLVTSQGLIASVLSDPLSF